ncbi:NAD-dependent DNA ligase LigA [Mesomycoplasma ovipneumoniae]|uniref:DNA ligase n=1 Tax=Mesomycoplasma ovipneumoniae TaxID=29562 RepID=A0AAP6CVX5_9BACT|nr:NAD-dependent DNA ligase LigA [Mesomycoplasma ovipneumoniae]MDW2912558.1 NAD-dependent DNA ligase LigA [Mesomycoplasma ovipneumoniae]MDW2916413.1 NAD-dependent DNA ligase LigA [Mesomycoplasma ovipneumoniae]MDW2925682.1 NAD-dependent DNA ligase LigA [Mesomycoplasma ovipneumoniae]MDW2929012.1 NAD-dependent DNA ligase LigA [Mesomycoplasma ovipneumoniae]MDW2931789.1 NAD-dependent DNA ligase LigA [Mesomycoplasma ovipneumoniae]
MENNSKIRNEILELRKQIEIWNHHYYQLQNPLVDDLIYDKKLRELINLEQKYYYLFTLEELNSSPSQQVGSKITSKFAKIKHSVPMLSLNKAHTKSELEKWAQKAMVILENVTFFVEPKIDGISLSLIYKNGQLIQALTRGDGVFGEDVLVNVLKIEDKFIPKSIDYFDDLEIRGEIYIDNFAFESLQTETNVFKNPRNAASGILRRYKKNQKDSNSDDFSFLSGFFYTLVEPEKHKIFRQSEAITFLKKLGFKTNDFQKKCNNLNEVFDFIAQIKQKRDQLNYNIDGVVIKINEFFLYDQLGFTSKFPHSIIAFKFEDGVAKTKLLEIFPTIGRTGKVTYNAKIEPVNLGGSLISSAVLPNYSYIENLKLNLMSDVFVKKAGEIIPQIIGSVEKHEKTNFSIAKNCPKCQSELIFSESGIDQFCQNKNCPGIILQKIVHFSSKAALNIETLAEKRIQTLLDKKIISNICDIFDLKNNLEKIYSEFKPSQLNSENKRAPSLQIKSVIKLLNEVEKAKNIDFHRLIFGLGIKNVGIKAAKILARYAKNISELRKLDFGILKNQNDFGPVIINSLTEYFNNEENQKLFDCLEKVNFDFKSPTISPSLIGWTSFAISGKLSKPRHEFVKIIEQTGAYFHTSITKQTAYLVTGESTGSKIEKAIKLGVKRISEEEFWELIKSKIE